MKVLGPSRPKVQSSNLLYVSTPKPITLSLKNRRYYLSAISSSAIRDIIARRITLNLMDELEEKQKKLFLALKLGRIAMNDLGLRPLVNSRVEGIFGHRIQG